MPGQYDAGGFGGDQHQQAAAAAPDMSWQNIPDHGIKVFTIESIPGESDVTAIGEVTGVAQRPRHRSEETLTRAHQDAVREAVTMAKNSDADAIIGLRYTEGPESVVAYGTAVKLGSSADTTSATDEADSSHDSGASTGFGDTSYTESYSDSSFGQSDQAQSDFQSTDYQQQTDYGQSDFQQSDQSQSEFGQSDFGQSEFGQNDFGQSDAAQGQEAYQNPYEQQSGDWPFRSN